MTMTELNLSADTIDVRDIIARVEDLRGERDAHNDSEQTDWHTEYESDAEELANLESILADLAGSGGDEQWEGAWYPSLLIADWHFRVYAQELAEEVCSDAVAGASWPLTCIDWERAARELRMDYTSTEIDGATYWFR
jgi:hypothetical protein